MLDGLLIKGFGGFYFVEAEGTLYTCTLRGKFRIKNQTFLPGDRVKITPLEESKGVIEDVAERRNELTRPAVANVDQVVVTFALKSPPPDLLLLDRILIQSLSLAITPLICFNKTDLVKDEQDCAPVAAYRAAGYRILTVSARQDHGIDEVKAAMQGRLTVMAGPSGAGKSSILNSFQKGFQLQTGELSKKVARGKHTTRRVELLKLTADTYVADTPGFTSLHLPSTITKPDLRQYYPEWRDTAETCPFKSCLHWKERDCQVRRHVELGHLDGGRYERYITLLKELQEREGKY